MIMIPNQIPKNKLTVLAFSSIRYGMAIGKPHEIPMREIFLDAWHEWVESL